MKNKKWRRICQSKSSLEKQKTKFKEMNSLNWKFLEMDLIFRDFGEIWTISKEKEVEISSKWSRATGFWEQRRRHVHCLCFVFLFFVFCGWRTREPSWISSRHSVPYKVKLTWWSVIINQRTLLAILQKIRKY